MRPPPGAAAACGRADAAGGPVPGSHHSAAWGVISLPVSPRSGVTPVLHPGVCALAAAVRFTCLCIAHTCDSLKSVQPGPGELRTLGKGPLFEVAPGTRQVGSRFHGLVEFICSES